MVLLSATMPVEVLEVTECFMQNPIQILVKKEELTLEGIRQYYINVGKDVSHLFYYLLFFQKLIFFLKTTNRTTNRQPYRSANL